MSKKQKNKPHLYEIQFGTIAPKTVYAVGEQPIPVDMLIGELNRLCTKDNSIVPIPEDIEVLLGEFGLTRVEPTTVFHGFSCHRNCTGWHQDVLPKDYPNVGLGAEFDELVSSGAIPEEENSCQYTETWLKDKEKR